MGNGGSGETSDEDGDEDGESIKHYRGEIRTSDWEEFKRNVPRTVTLMDKVNELIREFNKEQRDDDNGNSI